MVVSSNRHIVWHYYRVSDVWWWVAIDTLFDIITECRTCGGEWQSTHYLTLLPSVGRMVVSGNRHIVWHYYRVSDVWWWVAIDTLFDIITECRTYGGEWQSTHCLTLLPSVGRVVVSGNRHIVWHYYRVSDVWWWVAIDTLFDIITECRTWGGEWQSTHCLTLLPSVGCMVVSGNRHIVWHYYRVSDVRWWVAIDTLFDIITECRMYGGEWQSTHCLTLLPSVGREVVSGNRHIVWHYYRVSDVWWWVVIDTLFDIITECRTYGVEWQSTHCLTLLPSVVRMVVSGNRHIVWHYYRVSDVWWWVAIDTLFDIITECRTCGGEWQSTHCLTLLPSVGRVVVSGNRHIVWHYYRVSDVRWWVAIDTLFDIITECRMYGGEWQSTHCLTLLPSVGREVVSGNRHIVWHYYRVSDVWWWVAIDTLFDIITECRTWGGEWQSTHCLTLLPSVGCMVVSGNRHIVWHYYRVSDVRWWVAIDTLFDIITECRMYGGEWQSTHCLTLLPSVGREVVSGNRHIVWHYYRVSDVWWWVAIDTLFDIINECRTYGGEWQSTHCLTLLLSVGRVVVSGNRHIVWHYYRVSDVWWWVAIDTLFDIITECRTCGGEWQSTHCLTLLPSVGRMVVSGNRHIVWHYYRVLDVRWWVAIDTLFDIITECRTWGGEWQSTHCLTLLPSVGRVVVSSNRHIVWHYYRVSDVWWWVAIDTLFDIITECRTCGGEWQSTSHGELIALVSVMASWWRYDLSRWTHCACFSQYTMVEVRTLTVNSLRLFQSVLHGGGTTSHGELIALVSVSASWWRYDLSRWTHCACFSLCFMVEVRPLTVNSLRLFQSVLHGGGTTSHGELIALVSVSIPWWKYDLSRWTHCACFSLCFMVEVRPLTVNPLRLFQSVLHGGGTTSHGELIALVSVCASWWRYDLSRWTHCACFSQCFMVEVRPLTANSLRLFQSVLHGGGTTSHGELIALVSVIASWWRYDLSRWTHCACFSLCFIVEVRPLTVNSLRLFQSVYHGEGTTSHGELIALVSVIASWWRYDLSRWTHCACFSLCFIVEVRPLTVNSLRLFQSVYHGEGTTSHGELIALVSVIAWWWRYDLSRWTHCACFSLCFIVEVRPLTVNSLRLFQSVYHGEGTTSHGELIALVSVIASWWRYDLSRWTHCACFSLCFMVEVRRLTVNSLRLFLSVLHCGGTTSHGELIALVSVSIPWWRYDLSRWTHCACFSLCFMVEVRPLTVNSLRLFQSVLHGGGTTSHGELIALVSVCASWWRYDLSRWTHCACFSLGFIVEVRPLTVNSLRLFQSVYHGEGTTSHGELIALVSVCASWWRYDLSRWTHYTCFSQCSML